MKEDAGLNAQYQRDLSFINSEIDRLNNSLVQLLSFSKPVSDKQAEVDLTEMLRNTIQFFSRARTEDQVRIECDLAEALVLPQANPDGVREIITNLLINALQASPRGGKIGLRAYRRNGASVILEISDEGPGIPADLHGKIFEPFFTTKQKGTGLGLAIVKKNVGYLGGKIFLESPLRDERGTKFTVVFSRQAFTERMKDEG
jgi:signal transduction histidine kinase